MMIRQITPADQEQLLLLEEELHDNEGKEHRATLEAVSYTHLDVYKRQAGASALQLNLVNLNKKRPKNY